MSASTRTSSAGGGPGAPPAPPGPRSRTPGRSWRGQEGFTLIETLIAAVVLVVGLGALFGLLDSSVKTTSATRAREGASNLARQILEDAHTIDYAQLTPSAITEQLQAMGLSDSSAETGWQLERRQVVYTVVAEECAIDDGKDFYGKHEVKTNYCSDSQTEPAAGEKEDNQPEDLKRITIFVKWKSQNKTHEIRQTQTISSAGEAIGLTASGLKMIFPKESTAPLISVEPAGKEVEFEVQAPSATSAVYWSLEGNRQPAGATHGTGTKWTFWWNIGGVSDGTYEVTAQAVNGSGVIGPPVSINVILIRNTPVAPKSIQGGFNKLFVLGVEKQVAEFKWAANSERNVLGYRVYNPEGSLVCPEKASTLSTAVACTDFKPPSEKAANLQYKVVALYRKAEGEQLSSTISEGPAATYTLPTPESKPNPPGVLNLEKTAEGTTVLKWTAPASGPAVSFYRIYRESSNYTGRYDVTGSGSTTTYTDTEAGSLSHTYWVTSVTSNLTESTMIGPVTG